MEAPAPSRRSAATARRTLRCCRLKYAGDIRTRGSATSAPPNVRGPSESRGGRGRENTRSRVRATVRSWRSEHRRRSRCSPLRSIQERPDSPSAHGDAELGDLVCRLLLEKNNTQPPAILTNKHRHEQTSARLSTPSNSRARLTRALHA